MATADLLSTPTMSEAEIIAALSHPDALWEIEFGRVVEKPLSALAIAISSRLMELVAANCRRPGLGC